MHWIVLFTYSRLGDGIGDCNPDEMLHTGDCISDGDFPYTR